MTAREMTDDEMIDVLAGHFRKHGKSLTCERYDKENFQPTRKRTDLEKQQMRLDLK